ncbi:MAG: class I SAM-dependent methyltransferase [Sphingobacteriaceae bacterium]|nr:class I SAM-dependent methyltransferase [Sphingobacteriaceae bacterium]
MHSIQSCPVCHNNDFKEVITCKDYTVSGELFNIVACAKCDFRFTNPRPENEVLGEYYKSEDYISHSDTKKGIVSKLYHLVRDYTLKKKEGLLREYVSRGTLLDYGCGTGMFLQTCKKMSWKVYGLEPDSGARKLAEKHGLEIKQNLNELNQTIPERSLNAITLWHVLEHVTELDQTLSFFHKSLNSDGVLVIAVPNYCSYDAKYYGEYWAAYDVPRHLYHFNLNSISNLLANHGFKLLQTKPMKFDSYYVSLLSEKYKSGRPSLIKAFLRGFISNLKAKSASDYSSVIYTFKKA